MAVGENLLPEDKRDLRRLESDGSSRRGNEVPLHGDVQFLQSGSRGGSQYGPDRNKTVWRKKCLKCTKVPKMSKIKTTKSKNKRQKATGDKRPATPNLQPATCKGHLAR